MHSQLHGKRHGAHAVHEHRGHRWHHDPEQGPMGRGRHHGHGGGRGRHDGPGRHGLHSGRKLSAADLQLILMAQLASRPAHGYELIKALEDHSHGLYVPSPGMIYPALTYLEEIGYASVEMEGTKKRYSLTEAGRDHYEQNRTAATQILAEMERIGAEMARARQVVESGLAPDESADGPANAALDAARHELRHALHKPVPYTPEEARRIAEILLRTATEIRGVLAPSTEL